MTARRTGLLLGLLLLVPAAGLGQSLPDSTNRLLLTDARLVDPATKTVTRGALQIEGERIAAVLENAPAAFDGRTLDLEGRWVLPGLVDAHVHSWGNAGPTLQQRQMLQTSGTAKMMLYAGATAFLDLFSPEDYIFDLRNQQRTDGLLGAQPESTSSPPLGADIYAAGPILTRPKGHGTEYGVPTRTVTGPADARQTVDSLSARAPDVVKLVYHPYHTERYPSMDRPTMEAIVEAARARDLPTVVHIESWRAVHDVVTAGADAITHTPPTPIPDSVVAEMKRRGTAWIPTLAVHTELSHLVNHTGRLENDLLRAVADSALLSSYRDTSGTPAQIQSWMTRQSEHRSTRLVSVSAAHQAGIPILAGTDAGNPGLFQGYSIHREIQLLIEGDLSPWAALGAATTAPARFLDAPFGLQDDDRANLLVLNSSPIEDVRATQDIHRVIYRGQLIDRASVLDQAADSGVHVPAR